MNTPIGNKLSQDIPRGVAKFRENRPRDVERSVDEKKRKNSTTKTIAGDCNKCRADSQRWKGMAWNGMLYTGTSSFYLIPYRHFLPDKLTYHTGMPNGQCRPECMQMQRRSLTINRVEDELTPTKRQFQLKMYQIPFGGRPGSVGTRWGSLQRSHTP